VTFIVTISLFMGGEGNRASLRSLVHEVFFFNQQIDFTLINQLHCFGYHHVSPSGSNFAIISAYRRQLSRTTSEEAVMFLAIAKNITGVTKRKIYGCLEICCS